MAYLPIRDYAVIGNLRSAVLVSKTGSIDWAPAPFIDSPSIFAALLDENQGGSWSVAPVHPFEATQHYIERTNVVVTEFTTETGTVRVTDFLPIEKEKTYLPAEEDTTFKIKRKVECTTGRVEVVVLFNPRFNYARGVTELALLGRGVQARNGKRMGVLVSRRSFVVGEKGAQTTFTMGKGEAEFFVFRYNIGHVEEEKDNFDHHNEELETNILYWQNWEKRCDFEKCVPAGGVWHDVVVRSLLIVKILFFEPVGTVAAAPTTSLPEHIGGVRNWDYRFTWLRDSAFVFKVFFRLGHAKEAEEYIRWLVSKCSAANDPSQLRVLYNLRDDNDNSECILPHLEGYRQSNPVRIGNDAENQTQLDIYGSIFDMIWALYELKGGHALEKTTWKLLAAIADYVAGVWEEPDEGLWEVRGGKNHYTYSKVMCWVALDRACRLQKALNFEEGDTALWEEEKGKIEKWIYAHGYSAKKHTFVQSAGSDDLDAALLLLSKAGFIKGDDPKMVATIRAIQKELCPDDTFVYRYTSPDGLPGREGAFLVASFWLVDALVLAGEVNEARHLFERVISHINHVHLFSEEIDPQTKEFLGNFPQAYTHVGLMNSAILLADVGKTDVLE